MFETELRMIREYLKDYPREAALSLAKLPLADAAAILADQPAELGARLLEHMRPIDAGERLCRMEPQSASALLCRLPPSQATSLLRRLPMDARHAVVAVTPEHWAKPWSKALSYRDGTAGALMDNAPQTITADLTVADALVEIRRQSGALYSELFVVDADHVLVGAILLSVLIREPADEAVKRVMHSPRVVVGPGEELDSVRRNPAVFDLDVVPVADTERKLVGVLPTRRLRQSSRRSLAGGSGVGTMVALSEVCWSGMAGAIDGLMTLSSQVAEKQGGA